MNGKPEGEVTKMAGMADHRKTAKNGKSSAKAAAWSVLITMGGTSVTLNIWDATHAAHPLYGLIAVLKGLAPVLAAMLLSEAGARFDGGKVFRGVAFGIMGGAMVLSASAVASVLRPSYPAGVLGVLMSWLFGLVLDAAALTGLWIILTERERRREAEREEEARDAGRELAEAVAAAEERVRDESAAVIAGVRAELADANATAEALRSAAHGRRTKRSSGGAQKPRKSAQGSADTEDMTTELRALQMLDAHPELRAKGQGAELARRLGVSPAHGRRLHARLTAEERPDSALNERTHERDDERTDERS